MDLFGYPVWFGLRLGGTPGLVVVVAFLAVGISRIDHAAQDAYAFRSLLISSIFFWWPLVLRRCAVFARVREG